VIAAGPPARPDPLDFQKSLDILETLFRLGRKCRSVQYCAEAIASTSIPHLETAGVAIDAA
jgi:hypothetical protein